jgi:hypothetical protein
MSRDLGGQGLNMHFFPSSVSYVHTDKARRETIIINQKPTSANTSVELIKWCTLNSVADPGISKREGAVVARGFRGLS